MSGKPVILSAPAYAGLDRFLSAYEIIHQPTDESERPAFLRDVAPRIEAVLTTSSQGVEDDVLAAATALKLIALFGAGYEGFDLAALAARGVAVTNCPNINHEDVADVTMGLLLSATRDIARGDRQVRSAAWRDGLVWPRRLRGQKLGVVGFGAIGAAIAARGAAFGLEIKWTGPRAKPDAPYPFEPDLLALAHWADILAVASRADPGTEKMIDARVIAALGAQGVLINIARGSVIDEDALITALKDGSLGGAGLDVFEEEPTPAARWADIANVTLTPHFAGGTRESLRESAMYVVENLRRQFAGEALLSRVN